MDMPRKGGAPQGRFLVAMRPEPAATEVSDMARVLGLKPEQAREVFGGGWPRIVAARSSLEDADSLARVFTARGREAVAWDKEVTLIDLFHAERLRVEAGQILLEQARAHRIYPAANIHCVVDLRIRTEQRSEQLPDRALLIVPVPGWSQPGVLSTWSVATGDVTLPQLAAAQLVQAAAVSVRSLLPDRLSEIRASAASMGLDERDGEPLERMLQLLARLPPALPSRPGGG